MHKNPGDYRRDLLFLISDYLPDCLLQIGDQIINIFNSHT